MAAVEAMEQLATDGELDYGELAMNLVINTVADVGLDAVTGSIPGGDGRSKGGRGALDEAGEFNESLIYLPNQKVDVDGLPGAAGMKVPRRLTVEIVMLWRV